MIKKELPYEKALRVYKIMCFYIENPELCQNIGFSLSEVIGDCKAFEIAAEELQEEIDNVSASEIIEFQVKIEILELVKKNSEKIKRLEKMKAFW